MNRRLSVLLIDDDEEEYFLVRNMLRAQTGTQGQIRLQADWVSTYAEAVTAFKQRAYQVYLIDYHLGERTGLDLLREAAALGIQEPLILLTGQGSYDIDLAAMAEGAADYLDKSDLTLPLLERTIRYALERKQTQNLLRQRAEEMEALHSATAALLSTLDLETLLSQILDAALRAFPMAGKACLHLREDFLRGLHPGSFADPRIFLLNPHAGPHLSSADFPDNRPAQIADTRAPGLEISSIFAAEVQAGALSLLSAPMCKEEQLFGALTLTSGQAGAFGDAQLHLLETFAATANAAIENGILHAEIQQLATIDSLTGLYNRRSLEELGKREVDRFYRFERPLTLMMFDLDGFKLINDTYGHQAGDQVLRGVTDRFRANIRHTDILGRYGGDEFVLILPETDLPTACTIAERILEAVQCEPIESLAGPIETTTSLGITHATRETATLESLVAQADKALYRAKQNGRGRIEIA